MEEIGYLGILLWGLGGGFFGMAAGSIAAGLGKLDPILVFMIGLTSNYLSDLILYYGAKYNRNLYQSYISNPKYRRSWAYSRLMLRKYGSGMIFIQKFIHIVKTIVPITLGITEYCQKRFLILDLFASFLWTVIVFFVFYSLGESGDVVVTWFETYGWVIPLSILSILAVCYYYLREKGVFKKKPTRSRQ